MQSRAWTGKAGARRDGDGTSAPPWQWERPRENKQQLFSIPTALRYRLVPTAEHASYNNQHTTPVSIIMEHRHEGFEVLPRRPRNRLAASLTLPERAGQDERLEKFTPHTTSSQQQQPCVVLCCSTSCLHSRANHRQRHRLCFYFGFIPSSRCRPSAEG